MTVYEKIKELRVPMDNSGTSLLVPLTEETMETIRGYEFIDKVSTFKHKGETWLEIPHAFPYPDSEKSNHTMKWYPIETAPHTKDVILVCDMNQGGVKDLVSWNGVHGFWKSHILSEPVIFFTSKYTHWTPIDAVDLEKIG